MDHAGKILLFGTGAAGPVGQSILRKIFSSAGELQNIAILETPAGFQPNTNIVAGEVSQAYQESLAEFIKDIHVIPARKKNTDFSPDDPAILAPLKEANFIFLGPGSPTYTVKQLKDSLTLQMMVDRWKEGATLGFSSAAAIALGEYTLPVYEIFKVGEDLHWIPGLNIFSAFGLHFTIIAHWNNMEGGQKLDTSRCYMGQERFEKLLQLLPQDATVLGIDENTVVVIDVQTQSFTVLGKGSMTLIKQGKSYTFEPEKFYALSALDDGNPKEGKIFLEQKKLEREREESVEIPDDVQALLHKREEARKNKDFASSDLLRSIIREKGYLVEDTPTGQHLYKAE